MTMKWSDKPSEAVSVNIVRCRSGYEEIKPVTMIVCGERNVLP